MKRIVVPLNSAPGSVLAVDAARRLATTLGARVELVHVHEDGGDQAEAQLDEGRRRLVQAGVEVAVVQLEAGRVGARLVEQARGADLIVMRSEAHRAAGAETGQVTSTTLEVLRRAKCPLLAITQRTTSMINPLLAYNGSPQSRAAMVSALTALGPDLFEQGTVLVVTSDEHMAERLADEIRILAAERGVTLATHWSPGRPGRTIDEQLKRGRHDLVVMGALGRSWLKERIFGSTTNQMLRRCPVPIWMSQ